MITAWWRLNFLHSFTALTDAVPLAHLNILPVCYSIFILSVWLLYEQFSKSLFHEYLYVWLPRCHDWIQTIYSPLIVILRMICMSDPVNRVDHCFMSLSFLWWPWAAASTVFFLSHMKSLIVTEEVFQNYKWKNFMHLKR